MRTQSRRSFCRQDRETNYLGCHGKERPGKSISARTTGPEHLWTARKTWNCFGNRTGWMKQEANVL
ncbi:MAG: hypothetical protein P8Y68_18030 [Anaerolineales bacterium]